MIKIARPALLLGTLALTVSQVVLADTPPRCVWAGILGLDLHGCEEVFFPDNGSRYPIDDFRGFAPGDTVVVAFNDFVQMQCAGWSRSTIASIYVLGWRDLDFGCSTIFRDEEYGCMGFISPKYGQFNYLGPAVALDRRYQLWGEVSLEQPGPIPECSFGPIVRVTHADTCSDSNTVIVRSTWGKAKGLFR